MARPRSSTKFIEQTVRLALTEELILENFTTDQLFAMLQKKLSGGASTSGGSASATGRRRGRPPRSESAESSETGGQRRGRRGRRKRTLPAGVTPEALAKWDAKPVTELSEQEASNLLRYKHTGGRSKKKPELMRHLAKLTRGKK